MAEDEQQMSRELVGHTLARHDGRPEQFAWKFTRNRNKYPGLPDDFKLTSIQLADLNPDLDPDLVSFRKPVQQFMFVESSEM